MKRSGTWLALAALVWAGCAPAADQEPPPGATTQAAPGPTGSAEPSVPASAGDLIQGDTIPGLPSWTRQDWEILRRTVTAARQSRVDTLPVGKRIARIGETFVGSPYLPGTLDPPGPERLVINLRAMDCVTFVENMLAMAHFVREAPADVLERPEEAMRLYQAMIERVRYRDGRLAGYPSRLHYFTDWLGDNARRGIVRLVTKDLGGVVDVEPISWMSAHRPQKPGDPYPPLMDESVYQEIRRAEARLNEMPRIYIPEENVAAIMDRLEDGDILAMTSTLPGLDVAHTGIAIWKDGAVHLLNAPLVGKSVEISEKTIPDRLAGIKSQDGLMVGRPAERNLILLGK
jgi:hypothetical protein